MPCVHAYEPVSAAVEIPEGSASRSKLVWAGDGAATNGIVSFYRHSFSLPAKPENATLDSYLDDDGHVFVNGREVPSRGDASGAPVDRIIESPDIDFISNPPFTDARARLSGGGFAPRTLPATLRRHGKFLLVEDDSRFHHLSGWLKGSQNLATKTVLETEMNVRRNWLNQFFDGDGIQLCDSVKGVGERPNAFDDPAVFKGIADAKAALRKAGVASFSSGNAVAVVTSPRERLRMDGRPDSPFTRLVCQQPYLDVCRESGTPCASYSRTRSSPPRS